MLVIRRKMNESVILEVDGKAVMKIQITRPEGRGRNFVEMRFEGGSDIRIHRSENVEYEGIELNYNQEQYNK